MSDAPSIRDYLAVLARRLARPLSLDVAALDGFVRGSHSERSAAFIALREVALHARRHRARRIDALLTPEALHVAFDGAHWSFPTTPSRARALVQSAFGVPLILERAATVSLPGPKPDAPAAVTAARIARAHLARIRSLETEAILDIDPEGIHQLRVAIRRFRAALRVLDTVVHDPALERLHDVARNLSRIAGSVRDCDVFIDLVQTVSPHGAARETALAHAFRLRRTALTRLRKTLTSRAHQTRMANTDAFLARMCTHTHSGLPSIAEVGRTCTRRELRRLRRRLERSDLTTFTGYHRVRRQLRRVRDHLEVFHTVLPRRHTRWRQRLQPIQALLGRLHDLDVALTLLPMSLKDTAPVREALIQRRYQTLAELAAPLALLAVAVSKY